MMSTFFGLRFEQACSAALIQPINKSIPKPRAMVRQTPPNSQPRCRSQWFRPPGNKNCHRWPVRIRLIPAQSNSAETFWGSPTSRLMEGSSVTTVTSHPSRVKCVAIFQFLTQETAVAGGNEYARNSSLGLLFDSMLLVARLLVKVALLVGSILFTAIQFSDHKSNTGFRNTIIVNYWALTTLRYNSSSSLFKAFVSNFSSIFLLPACPISLQISGSRIR